MTRLRSAAANTLGKTASRAFLTGFLATVALMGGIAINAQGIGGHNTNAPVSYAADRIELQDRTNRIVLSGGVDITQGGLRMRSARTLIDYSDAGSLQIQRITATGGVDVTRGTERARGDVAIYDFNRRIITMSGNVRLNRGGDTLNGGRLVIDLRTGVSSIDGRAGATGAGTGSGNTGRVSGTFSVPEN